MTNRTEAVSPKGTTPQTEEQMVAALKASIAAVKPATKQVEHFGKMVTVYLWTDGEYRFGREPSAAEASATSKLFGRVRGVR